MGRHTRRSVLAAVGGVALAGCLGSDDYWDDPPTFDDDGLETVTERPLPDRPEEISVSLGGDQREAFSSRVDELLAPIPDPLTAEILPNGEIRAEIASEREMARAALERFTTETETLPAVRAAADATEHAATAAGVWAAVSVDESPHDVTRSASEISAEIDRLADELPDVAADPDDGAVVYGAIEEWLGGSTMRVHSQPNPLRVGRATGTLERLSTELAAGEHIRDRYVAALEHPRAIEAALSSAATELGPAVETRFARFHGDDVDRPRYGLDLDERVTRDARRNVPGVRLLSWKLSDFASESQIAPIAWPGFDSTRPALTIRETHRAIATLDALDALADRVDDGDDLFPPDAGTVEEARTGAIEAVDDLGSTRSSLERRFARRLVDAFDEPDETLTADAEPDRRSVASAYGEYVWIETLARAVPDATRLVADALERG